jgi:hypothetical protein
MKSFGLALGLLLGSASAAMAVCTGVSGVPFNCTAGNAPQSVDLLLGGSNTTPQTGETVQWTVGQLFAAPPSIGGTTPGAIAATTLSASGLTTLKGATTINLNGDSPPTALTGAVLRLTQANATSARLETDAYAGSAYFSGVRTDGTLASPTGLVAADEISGINGFGWNGAAVVGPAASFRLYSAETWASGHQGTYADIATTPIASTTLTEVLRFENDGGITMPGATGGDKGAGTINIPGGYYVNGTLIGTSGITWPTSADLVISNGTSSPAGLAPSGSLCAVSSSGVWTTGACGSGTGVTSLSVATANGLAGTVTATTTPVVTLTTSVTGLLKGNGTAVSAATAGTDYLAPAGSGAALTGTAASLTAGVATVANGLKTATTTVAVNVATAPTNGQVLTASNTTTAAWVTPSGGSITQLNASAIVANGQLGSTALPANNVLLYAILRETAGHAVNIALGTTSGATDVMPTVTVPASGVIEVSTLGFAKVWFSAGSTQSIYVTSASWGSASLNIDLVYQAGP